MCVMTYHVSTACLTSTLVPPQLMEGKDLTAGVDKGTAELKKLLAAAEKDRDSALKKAEALQSQAESTSREYDRLMAEHEKLQKKAGEAAGAAGKKDD